MSTDTSAAPQKKRGGRRPGAGRKASDGTLGTNKRSISLDPDRERVLIDYGRGKLSVGVRRAADLVKRTLSDGDQNES